MPLSTSDALNQLTSALRRFRDPYGIGHSQNYQTLQGAYEAAMDAGESPHLQIKEDYHPRDETYPVVMHGRQNGDWIPFDLSGPGMGNDRAQLGHKDVKGDVLQLHGPPGGGQYSYKKPAVIRNLRIRNGGDKNTAHIRIAGLPNGRIRDTELAGSGNGVQWQGPFLDMAEGVGQSHSFGWHLNSVEAWGPHNAFQAGPQGGAHSTMFSDCRANNCRTGLQFKGASNVVWRGGDIQLCKGFGAALRECLSTTIRDCYIEGNGRHIDYPIEVYARTCSGLTIDSNYFHGTNPRDTTHDYNWVQRGINLQDSRGVNVTNNTAVRYGDGLLSAHTMSEAEAHGNHEYKSSPIYGYIGGDSTVTEYGTPIAP